MSERTSAPARDRAAATPAPPADLASARSLLWSTLRAGPRDLIASSVLYSTHQLGESLVPVIVGATIGGAVAHGNGAAIAGWLAVLGADFAFLSLSYRHGARASMRAKQHAAHRVRMRLTERVVGRAGGVDRPPGDLLSRASSDADRVGAYAGMLAVAVSAVVVLVAATVLLLSISPLLGATILAGTALLLIVQHAVSGPLERRSGAEQDRRARATVLAEDIVRGLRVLKGIGSGRNAADGYRRVSGEAADASVRAASSGALLTAIGSGLTGVYLLAIVTTGGWLALTGRLGLGPLIAALGLAQFVIGPMQTLSGVPATYARALASAERIREVLLAPAAVTDLSPSAPSVAHAPGGELAFAAVGLPGRTLTARVPAGTMTGLVCGDPVAAARLPLLLAREQDPPTGDVLLDGIPIAALPLDVLRSRILVGLHDAALLPGSVADNVSALSASAAGAARALRAAGVDDVVGSLPAGADTAVGERGETLSGGQRQRVALARALAAEPPVLVLHDPTTAVDAATEDGIAERVHELRAGSTTLLIATSPAWLSRCESVVFLTADGCRVAAHDALMGDADYREAVAR